MLQSVRMTTKQFVCVEWIRIRLDLKLAVRNPESESGMTILDPGSWSGNEHFDTIIYCFRQIHTRGLDVVTVYLCSVITD